MGATRIFQGEETCQEPGPRPLKWNIPSSFVEYGLKYFFKACQTRGLMPANAEANVTSPDRAAAPVAMRQTRKSQAFMPDFRTYITFRMAHPLPWPLPRVLQQDLALPDLVIPAGAKLLSSVPCIAAKGGEGEQVTGNVPSLERDAGVTLIFPSNKKGLFLAKPSGVPKLLAMGRHDWASKTSHDC